MDEEKSYSLLEAQREFARITNNRVWDLIEKKDRTSIDDEEMLLAAHTSLYHWLQIGTAVNAQRGHWLLLRVYILLGLSQNAVEHALGPAYSPVLPAFCLAFPKTLLNTP